MDARVRFHEMDAEARYEGSSRSGDNLLARHQRGNVHDEVNANI